MILIAVFLSITCFGSSGPFKDFAEKKHATTVLIGEPIRGNMEVEIQKDLLVSYIEVAEGLTKFEFEKINAGTPKKIVYDIRVDLTDSLFEKKRYCLIFPEEVPRYCLPSKRLIVPVSNFLNHLFEYLKVESMSFWSVSAFLAHEFTHAAQHAAGLMKFASTKSLEHQADCVAGFVTKKVMQQLRRERIAVHNEKISSDEKIKNSALQFFSKAGSRDHGTNEERIANFSKGFDGKDINVCNSAELPLF